jgi:DNA-binding HxlR family transcriptional regulator
MEGSLIHVTSKDKQNVLYAMDMATTGLTVEEIKQRIDSMSLMRIRITLGALEKDGIVRGEYTNGKRLYFLTKKCLKSVH